MGSNEPDAEPESLLGTLGRQALEALADGVLLAGPDRTILYANPAFEAITGYSRQDVLGRNCSLLQGAGTSPRTVEAIRLALDEGRPFAGEILNYRRDGTPFWNALRLTPLRARDGALLGFLGVQRDMTREFETASALQRTQEQLRTMLDNAPMVAFLKDLDGRYLLINKAFADFLGRGPLPPGVTDLDLFPADFAEQCLRRDRAIAESGEPVQFEHVVGDRVFFETKFPVRDAAGRVFAIGGVSVEVTDRRHAEEQLALLRARLEKERALVALGAVTAEVAHEVRNPLFGITASLDAWEAMPDGEPRWRATPRLVANLRAQVERLQGVMSGLLELGRRQAAPGPHPVDAFAVASAAAGQVEALAGEQQVQVELDDRLGEAVLADLDESAVVVALRNLIDNAIRHSRPGQVVRVGVERTAEALAWCVEDRGPGFAAEALERARTPFFSRRRGGTGLGLSIAERVAQDHGGALELANGPAGARAVLRLPLAAAGRSA
jgi:PAS domain S-box-containing protein